jgi:hypothetical protein
MRAFFCLIFLPFFLYSAPDTFSSDRLKKFGNDFYSEQKDQLFEAGLTEIESSEKLSPAPKKGFLPVLITNDTGFSDNQVYVILEGQQIAGGTQYFFSLDKSTGVYTPHIATVSSYSPNYSYRFSELPSSITGSSDRIVYVPDLNGARFYFSINRPIYLASKTGNAIAAPSYFAFYDPNFNTLFESVELTYTNDFIYKQPPPVIPWTASINTTEVDAFGLPIKIQYYSHNPSNPSKLIPVIQAPNALPSGFGEGGLAGNTTRSAILNSVHSGLSSGDLTGQNVWTRLVIPYYSDPYTPSGLQTYLRILSPKQGVGNDPSTAIQMQGGISIQHLNTVQGTGGVPRFYNSNFPFFPYDYFSSTSFGNSNSFADDLFSYYTGGTDLYISTGGQSPAIYQGSTSGASPNQTITFTLFSGSGPSPLTIDQGNLNVYKMYSGNQEIGASPSPIGFYFGDAFTAGILPSTTGTASGTPINITDATNGGWEDTNVPNYYTPLNNLLPGGPWYSLYAKELHQVAIRTTFTAPTPNFLSGVGLCYAYDFDDSLGISGTITPKNTTPESDNLYLRITLGKIDTAVPNPFADTNSYDVTFKTPSNTRTLFYRQGNTGPYIQVPFNPSGTTISGLFSNQFTPLYIRYTNNQGTSDYIVYLYHQFLVPQGRYSDAEISVINSTTITPDNIPPTSFTINLLP